MISHAYNYDSDLGYISEGLSTSNVEIKEVLGAPLINTRIGDLSNNRARKLISSSC
jgi:hypothetical protein